MYQVDPQMGYDPNKKLGVRAQECLMHQHLLQSAEREFSLQSEHLLMCLLNAQLHHLYVRLLQTGFSQQKSSIDAKCAAITSSSANGNLSEAVQYFLKCL